MSEVPKFVRLNAEEVAAKAMDGEVIIINLATGVYCSTSGIGADAWTMLEASGDVGRTIEGLAASYDVDVARCRGDVERFVSELVAERLFVAAEAASGNAAPTLPTAQRLSYAAPELTIYRDMQDLMALHPPMPSSMQIPWEDLSRRRS